MKQILFVFLILFSVASLDVKKGIGCPSTCTEVTLANLNASWFYNWNSASSLKTLPFIPMCFSDNNNRIDKLPAYSDILLGFNEPDNDGQSNMTVDEAYNVWPQLVAKSNMIASPVMAGNPAAAGSWLQAFMNKVPTPKVDIIAVHWYGGVSVSSFKNRMTDIYNKFQKPIWITEFACQTHYSSVQNPYKYTQAQVNAFLDGVIPWIQSQPWIHRYAWHDSEVGTSATWYNDGTLTETGLKYASF